MEEKDTKKTTTQGKGKGKNKKQTMNLNEFVNAGTTQTNSGFTTVSARWADVMDNEDEDSNSLVVLPTAPKSIRGPDIDVNLVPTQPPFICYLSNLPYEAGEEEIRKFFRDLKVLRVDLVPDLIANKRSRGQGTCEFSDRQSLIDAFAFNQETIKNRPVRISLRSYDSDQKGYRRDRDGGMSDRTSGDWRSGGKPDLKPMSNFTPSNRSYSDSNNSYGNRNRDYNNRNNYNNSSYNNRGSKYHSSDYGNWAEDNNEAPYDDGSNNHQSNRPERNYNNSYQNQQSDVNRPDRGDFTRDLMSKSMEPMEPRNEEPPRERPKLILNKPTKPRPEPLPVNPPTLSNRTESESSETDRSNYFENEAQFGRKRLILKPPSKKENTNPSDIKPNSSIFGEAKPVDTTKRLLEIESQLQEHDKEIEKELSAKLEKQPITESTDTEKDHHGSRDFNVKRRSDNDSHTGGGHMDRPQYRDNQDRNNRYDGAYRKPSNRRTNQYHNQSSGNRGYDNNNYNRDNRYDYNRGNKYNDSGNRTMNHDDRMIDNKRQDYEDQRPNRNSPGNNNSRTRQGQENFQQVNRFSVLNEEMD